MMAIVLFVLGLGGVLLVRFGVSRFVGMASSAARRVSQQPGHWWERTLVRWAFAIGGGIVLLGLLVGLLPGDWRNSVFTSPHFWLTVLAIGSYSFFAFAVMPGRWDDQAKKRVIRIARIFLVIVLLLIGSALAESQGWLDGKSWESLSAKVEDFSRPTPPPPVVWKGEKLVDLSKSNWTVVEIPRGMNEYRLEATPDPTAEVEISSPQWEGKTASIGGGVERELPWLPFDRKLQVRPKGNNPVTLKVMWR